MSAVATSTSVPIDDYRVVRPLMPPERGVLLAHDRRLDRAVVLHMLPVAEAARTSLLESARALARVSAPAVRARRTQPLSDGLPG